MALGPKELLELNEEDKDLLGRIEKTVDHYLNEKYSSGSISVPLRNSDLKTKICTELEKRYKDAGWKVAKIKHEPKGEKSLFLSVYAESTFSSHPYWDR